MTGKFLRGFFYLIVNPILFFKYLIRTLFLKLIPRRFFLQRLARNPYKRFGNISFPIDQKNPVTQKGIIESYRDYTVTERAIKATLFQTNEIDVEYNIKKFLRSGDVFFDVGAQFGYFSAVGAACVGEKGQVHMFEPVPFCADYLKDLQQQNPRYRLYLNQVAAGEKSEVAEITLSSPPHLSSHSLIKEYHRVKDIPEWHKVNVSIIRLDEYIQDKNIAPNLIKIDVEGYEFSVLRGLENFWRNTDSRPVIICEISPIEYRLGELFEFMERYGYGVYYSWNSNIKIRNTACLMGHNVIFRQIK